MRKLFIILLLRTGTLEGFRR